jgi:RNA polymerase sigma-70 factor, ECF subfamily
VATILDLTFLGVFSRVATPVAAAARTDEALMLEYQRGDENAFRELYQRYRGPLHRFIRRLIAHPAAAEEIFQDTWLAVITAKERYVTNAKFITYLFGIAHRRTSDYWRKRHRRASTELDDIGDPDAFRVDPEAGRTPLDCAVTADLGDALLAALDQLPVPQREAFLLKAEGNFTLEEIAQITGVGRETIKSRLRYAIERLREAMRAWQ